MAFNIGLRVSDYSIKKVLRSDDTGTAYLAANPTLPRYDTLKVLTAELSGDADFRSRFLQAAELAAVLAHPNIATVYTTGETHEHELWVTMQYVSGSDALTELQEQRMTVSRAVHIVGEVAKALDYAHGCNIVHGDVKPANFLLDATDARVLLTDFGVARAPQQGDQQGVEVDGPGDISALASSLYVLLTGATPVGAESGAAITAVLARATAEDPDDRYQSAGEFAAAAAEAVAGSAA